jgi:hypothetical protein
LQRLDQWAARQLRASVAADAALGSIGLLHQAFALVKADRLDVDPGGVGQSTDGQGFGIFIHGA